MKKKLFTLLLFVSTIYSGLSAQTYHQISGTEKVSCNEGDITANEWITYDKSSYTSRAKCESVAENIPNLSKAERVVVFYISGCESFDVVAEGNSNPRTLSIKVNGEVVDNSVWANGCSTHEGLKTNNIGESKVEIAGVDGSVYLSSVIFNAPSGPSDDATISSIKVDEETAILDGTIYSCELPGSYEGATASVVITPNNDKALVNVSSDTTPNEVTGAYTATIAIGTPITITVTAEAGNSSSYTLSLTKAASLSSDTSLSSLTVDGVEATPVEGDESKYTFDIAYAYTGALEIVATPTDNLSKVSTIVTPAVAAGASENVMFTVTAEDNSTKEYTLTITRAAAATECTLNSFTINGFAGVVDETAKTVKVKTIEGYDFSHTPVMSISALATAAWDKEAMKVIVTAEDATNATEYTVSVADENIQPFTANAYPYDLSFASATYTEPVEWIYGAPYKASMEALDKTATTPATIVGGYELQKGNTDSNISMGTNLLNIYLARCGTLTLNVGATGSREVIAKVNGTECAALTLSSNVAADLVCVINSDDPVNIVIEAFSLNKTARVPSTGGTRIYGMNATDYIDPTAIDSQSVEKAMNIYTANGIIYISSPIAQVINVYSIDGRLVRTLDLNEGENTIEGLAEGMYLINDSKVVINK